MTDKSAEYAQSREAISLEQILLECGRRFGVELSTRAATARTPIRRSQPRSNLLLTVLTLLPRLSNQLK
jgi:hypothetical protein